MNKQVAEYVLDGLVWLGATAVAILGAMSTQKWDSWAHRITNIAALIAILVAALKTLQTTLPTNAPAAPPPPAPIAAYRPLSQPQPALEPLPEAGIPHA